MAKKRKYLSHEEIWDDRGLIDSWNQAYEEYKKYRSIHARGEDVEKVLAAAVAAEADGNNDTEDANVTDAEDKQQEASNMGALGEWKPLIADDSTPAASGPEAAASAADAVPDYDHAGAAPSQAARALPETTSASSAPSMAMPSLMASSTDNEPLKSLMMSWYWAGYYTGLYEGQQRSQQHSSNGHQGSK